MSHLENADIDDLVVAAVKQYMQLLDTRTAPPLEDFLRQYAAIADSLRPSLEGLAMVHRAGDYSSANASASVSEPCDDNRTEETLSAKPIGDFQIVGELGRGGMGVVYEAIQMSLNRRVALKVLPFASGLDEVRLQRFRNEAHAAAALHHTNIVPVYAVGSDRGMHYYAMQLIEGTSLDGLLLQMRSANGGTGIPKTAFVTSDVKTPPSDPSGGQPFGKRSGVEDLMQVGRGQGADVETVAQYSTMLSSGQSERSRYYRRIVQMIHQAALAIEHAHRYGVVHRDIKPANLLLDGTGNIWVADFGLAQVQTDQPNLTRTGDPIGTLRYMSPEQATGRRDQMDHRTDIYSLGVTLYELLTLQPAIADGNYHEMLNRVALVETKAPKSVDPQLPIELDTIICKAIARAPEERYAEAGELASDLQAWLEDRPITARPPTAWERLSKWRRRNSGLVAATSVLLLVATAVLAGTTTTVWKQQQQTEQALNRETEQRKLAEERFQLARRAVDTFSLQSEKELSHRGSMQDLRRGFLETSLAFYKDLLSEHGTDSEFSDELLAVRDRVQSMVHELSVLDNAHAISQIRDIAVADHVGFLPQDREQLLKFLDSFDRRRDALPDAFIGGLQSQNIELSKLLEEFDIATKQWVTPVQLTRLYQLGRQRRLPTTFKNSEIVNALNLTSEQVEQIDQIIETTMPRSSRPKPGGSSRRNGGSSRSGGSVRNDPQVEAACKVAVRLITEVLSAPQRTQWHELVGEPFQW